MKPATKQAIVPKKPDVEVTALTALNAPDYLAEYKSERPDGFDEVRSSDIKGLAWLWRKR